MNDRAILVAGGLAAIAFYLDKSSSTSGSSTSGSSSSSTGGSNVPTADDVQAADPTASDQQAEVAAIASSENDLDTPTEIDSREGNAVASTGDDPDSATVGGGGVVQSGDAARDKLSGVEKFNLIENATGVSSSNFQLNGTSSGKTFVEFDSGIDPSVPGSWGSPGALGYDVTSWLLDKQTEITG